MRENPVADWDQIVNEGLSYFVKGAVSFVDQIRDFWSHKRDNSPFDFEPVQLANHLDSHHDLRFQVAFFLLGQLEPRPLLDQLRCVLFELGFDLLFLCELLKDAFFLRGKRHVVVQSHDDQRQHKHPPNGSHPRRESPEMSQCVDVPIADSRHGDQHAPESVPNDVEVMDPYSFFCEWSLVGSDSEAQKNHGNEKRNCQHCESPCLQVRFDCEARSRLESVELADSDGSFPRPISQMAKNSHENVKAENHKNKDVRVKGLLKLSTKLLLLDSPVQIRGCHCNADQQLNQEGPAQRTDEQVG